MQPVSSATEKHRFVVEAGQPTEKVAKDLVDAGLIRNEWVFMVISKITNRTIQAGVHYIDPSQNVIQVAFELQRAANTADEVTIRIGGGKTLAELEQDFLSIGFSEEEVQAAYAKKYDAPLLADKPTNASLEGYIFPDTYKIYVSDGLDKLLNLSFNTLYDKLKNDGSLLQIQQRGESIYETLTLASIVQKEVFNPDDQKMVAGVFKNRLAIGQVLGSDVTFHYAYKQGLCTLNTPACDSIYNTRIYAGLPPSPIANMEYTSIQAVLHPTEHNYYYFVAGDDGTTHYAQTEDEHLQNVSLYCTVLCR
jgi:UPF0755 protein